MPLRRRPHRMQGSADEVMRLDDIWPVFSDIAISFILILTFALIIQFIDLARVFDILSIQKRQNDLWSELQSDAFFQSLIEAGSLSREVSGNLQRFRFASDIVFQTGDATLQPRGEEILTRFARFLSAQSPRAVDIEIEGHTDRLPVTSGRYRDNWSLSAERATNVIRLFQRLITDRAQNVRLNPNRMSAIGYGEFRPIEDKYESQKNRRIEIRLKYDVEP